MAALWVNFYRYNLKIYKDGLVNDAFDATIRVSLLKKQMLILPRNATTRSTG